jgi:hypothetical protein
MYMGSMMLGRQKHTAAKPLVSEPNNFEFEWAIKKHKSHKSPGDDQIPAELIKKWDRTIPKQIYKLIASI